jgi:hypothetical protein
MPFAGRERFIAGLRTINPNTQFRREAKIGVLRFHKPAAPGGGGRSEQRAYFNVHLLPHSYAVFAVEK